MKPLKPATNGYPYEMRGKQMECVLCGTSHTTTAQSRHCWQTWQATPCIQKEGACMGAYYPFRPVQGTTWR